MSTKAREETHSDFVGTNFVLTTYLLNAKLSAAFQQTSHLKNTFFPVLQSVLCRQ